MTRQTIWYSESKAFNGEIYRAFPLSIDQATLTENVPAGLEGETTGTLQVIAR